VAGSNTTRDRILLTSLALFNAQGLAAVSTHKIAAELGMSPGNLHYHFKAKQLIVEWLFRRFEQRLESLNGSSAGIAAIDDLWLALHLRFEAINEYRFIYRDMAFLASEYPVLGQRAQALTAQNLLAAQSLCEGLVASGVIETSAEQARILALQMVFTTTCWLSFERLVPGRDALAQAGLPWDASLVREGQSTIGPAREAVKALLALPEPPTAIVSANNLMTIGVVSAIREAGLDIPDAVAVVGFDDFDWAEYFEPRLTVMAQPVQDIGLRAMKLLNKRIKTPDGPRQTVRLAPTFMVRRSCGCA